MSPENLETFVTKSIFLLQLSDLMNSLRKSSQFKTEQRTEISQKKTKL